MSRSKAYAIGVVVFLCLVGAFDVLVRTVEYVNASKAGGITGQAMTSGKNSPANTGSGNTFNYQD